MSSAHHRRRLLLAATVASPLVMLLPLVIFLPSIGRSFSSSASNERSRINASHGYSTGSNCHEAPPELVRTARSTLTHANVARAVTHK